MRLRKYFDYLRFMLRNWNTRLAIFTILHEIRGERKYQIDSIGVNDLKNLEIISGNKENAYIYQPVNYYMLEATFDFLKDQKINGALVDFGCGMGRIMAVAAHYGYKEITGIDFAPQLCNKAIENLKGIQNKYPETQFKIICDNAIHYPINERENVFFFFNPFDEVVLIPVIKNILQSVKEHPRNITVAYFNPTEKEIFLSAGFQEIWYFRKMPFLDFSILQLLS